MTALLFEPHPPPPPLARLTGNPLRQRLATARSLWRARRNLLHLFHPEVQEAGYHISTLGPERLVTVADVEIARHVLADRQGIYVKSPLYHTMLGEVLGPTASLLIEGEASRTRRRLLAPAFNARAMARVETVVAQHVDRLLDGWTGQTSVDLSSAMPRFAMSLAMDAFFSAGPGEEADRLATLIEALVIEAGSPGFADLARLPPWVPRGSRRRLRAMLAELNAALFALIDARLAGPPRAEADLLDVLIGARDAENGAALSRQDLRDEVMTLFLAGHETTALSLIWGIDRLAREPAAQAALRAAAASVGPTPTASRGLPLAGQTYDEMLRLYPPAFAVARTATAADSVGGLEIRPNDNVQIAVFMLHRSRRYWTEPARFDPSRFANRAPDAFIPFGAGPRLCIGMAFARLEALHLLCRLVSDFALTPDGPPPRPLGKITLRTQEPVSVALTPVGDGRGA